MTSKKRSQKRSLPEAETPAPEAAAGSRLPSLPFPVVGIGASVGGLDAFTQLLEALPADTGMALVLVQHLAPSHSSLLAEILSRTSRMPVVEVTDRMRVQPDRVHVIPPGMDMTLANGVLQLVPRREVRGQHGSIDRFFHSLAEAQGQRAIGVILSGSATDGTRGLEEIKAGGGITFAQDESARHGGMPGSAVASGCADFVLPPAEIAREIARIGRHPYVGRPPGSPAALSVPPPDVSRILELVREATGVDFSRYKANTLHRRITRRILLHKLAGVQEYESLLERQPDEIEALCDDILINVTSFFRNPEAFALLRTSILPRLMLDRSRHDPLRVWVVGCSTGEEAYSIAMEHAEFTEASGQRVPLQLFATDLSGTSIEKARAGVYPRTIAQDVSPERLRRFFVEEEGGYRVTRTIRDSCTFARHNVFGSPPFSHMDLVSCRNLLIYLEPALQQTVMPILHYALDPGGVLWLGSSESIGSSRNLFEQQDTGPMFLVRKTPALRLKFNLPLGEGLAAVSGRTPVKPRLREIGAGGEDAQKEVERILAARYLPPSVLINADLEILQFRGDTGPYLAPASGKASFQLLKMLREGLLLAVRGAILRARAEEVPVREEGLRVKSDSREREVDVEVIPIRGHTPQEASFLVLFEEKADLAGGRPRPPAVADPQSPEAAERESDRVRQELAATREYLQSVIEQQEEVNEQLQCANEEAQTANEELQSTNEELATSKEEIESSNEELATVNDELQQRNLELSQSNSDFANLLASAQMAIVMLGPDLSIRRFTPTSETLLNLIATDVGRPISDITLNVDVPDLAGLLEGVIETRLPRELEVQDRAGRWYSLRALPYRTPQNTIEGALLILVDIDSLKRAEQSLRESEARFRVLADSAPVLIWLHGLDGVQFVNRAYLEFSGASEQELPDHEWTALLHDDDREAYLSAFTGALARRTPFEALARFRRADGSYRWMKSVGVPRFTPDRRFLGMVGSSFDITDLKEAQESLQQADRDKNQFLAMLAHELRNPMAPLRNVAEIFRLTERDSENLRWAQSIMDRQLHTMTRMIEDLLDAARITEGKISLRRESVDLWTVLDFAIAVQRPAIELRRQTLHRALPSEPVTIEGDPTRLEQVFGNLIQNASKFTPEGGNIWIAAQVLGAEDAPAPGTRGEVVVRVRDDGCGIAPELLSHVFDLFVQGDRSLARMQGGLGIGLTMVQRLVRLHGGTVDVLSAGPGQGSEFVVRLPVTIASRPQTPRGPELPGETGADALRILVVDDNTDAAETLAVLLRQARHEVACAADGPAALDSVARFHPHVVVLDIGLPGMDGFELATRLRAHPATRDALLIALSGYGRDADIQRARQAGCNHHLVKPADPKALMDLFPRRARSGEARA